MNAGHKRILYICIASLALLLAMLGGTRALRAALPPSISAPVRSAMAPDAAGAWTVDSLADFSHGMATGIEIEAPGQARLDGAWWSDVRVNDPSPDSKFSPRATWVISTSAGVTQTIGLVVWADERQADHSPDIYVAQSIDHGRTWQPDVLVHDACDPDDPPYPECPGHFSPDVAVRSADNSLWVVWQHEEAGSGSDSGNIYYAASADAGATWPEVGTVTTLSGKQQTPRLTAGELYLYAIWEDESTDDGDIYIARYDPAVDTVWSTPIKVSDDTGGAEQRAPSFTVDAAGNVYAMWVDLRDDDDGEVFFARWTSGSAWSSTAWSSAVRLSAGGIDWADSPDVRAAGDGSIYAAWMERVPTGPATYDFQIVAARSIDQGNTWTVAVVHRLQNASATNAFYQAPAVGVNTAARVYVTWLHSPDAQAATSNIFYSTSFDQGSHWGLPRLLNSQQTVDVDSQPSIAVDGDGKTLVAWQDFRLGSSTHIFATAYPTDRHVMRGEYAALDHLGATATWGTLVWTATVPANTGLILYSRVLVNPATGWTGWLTHTQTGALAHPPGEAIQVRAVFTTNSFDTAILEGFQVTYQAIEHLYLPLVVTSN